MTRSHFSANRVVAATELVANEDGETDSGTVAPAECVGPIMIPAGLTRALYALATDAGADDLVPLSICATVLVTRLGSRRGIPGRARVIRGGQELITPLSTEPLDQEAGFRDALRRPVDFRVHAVPNTRVIGPVDVTFLISPDGLRLYVESMTNSADAPVAQCWARSFLHLLTGMADAPDTPIADLPLIDSAERDRILHRLNPYEDPEVRHNRMTGPFEEQVERSPDAVALIDEDGPPVSYRELNERANRLARFLLDNGAGPGTRIGICLDRGIHQVVAIYAAVKTGAAYVPIDVELPDSRLAYLLADAAPRHVLTDPACHDRIPDGPWHIHDLERDSSAWHARTATNPVVDTTPAALLHILYTSGTTGRPKGVAYPTDGALAHLDWMQGQLPVCGRRRRGVQDLCRVRRVDLGDLLAALARRAPGDLPAWWRTATRGTCARLVEAHGVTTMFLAPTVMTPFLEQVAPGRAGALRRVLCGGEPVTPGSATRFHTALPARDLVNCYGPTEAGNVTDMVLPPEPGRRGPARQARGELPVDRAGREPGSGAGRDARRGLHRRQDRSGAGVLARARPHRRAVRRGSLRAAGLAHVPHRRPLPVPR